MIRKRKWFFVRIEYIQSFVTLQKCGSFQKAAEVLHVTQPSLTSRIKVIEEELGCLLFKRTRTGVILTEQGEIFLPYACRILNSYQQAQYALKKDSSIRIGSATYSELTNKALNVLKLASHAEKLSMFIGTTNDMAEYLLTGKVDIAFSSQIDHPEISQFQLMEEPVSLVVSSTHHLIKNKGFISLAQLTQEQFVIWDTGADYWKEFQSELNRKGLSLCNTIEVGSFSTIKNMILSENMIALLPMSPLEEDVTTGSLRYIPTVPVQALHNKIYISFRKDASPAIMHWVTILQKQISNP